MSIKFVKRNINAVTPTRAHPSDVGLDIVSISKHKTISDNTILYDTGIAVSPPLGYYIEIVPRSRIPKSGWMLPNSVGTIDPHYTGNLFIALTRVNVNTEELQVPFCSCQMILRKVEMCEVQEVDETELKSTDRGSGGFGSTGTRTSYDIETSTASALHIAHSQ